MKYETAKKSLIEFLKGRFVKLALKKILGSAMMGGFKGWLVKFLAENLFDEVIVPIFNYLEDRAMFYYDKQVGAIRYRKLENAEEDGNVQDYNDATDDIMR